MAESTTASLAGAAQGYVRGACIAVILVGLAVLLGWLFDIPVLKSAIPGLVATKANAAIGFVLLGLSLLWLQNDQLRFWPSLAGRSCAFLAAAIGAVTLAQYAFAWDLGIDQWLFTEEPGAIRTSHPGRMAPHAALSFLLLGVALMRLDASARHGIRLAELLVVTVGFIVLSAFMGYVFNVTMLYDLPMSTGLALHSSLAFLLFCAAILYARYDRGVMKVFTSPRAGGIMARRLLLPAFTVPPLLGWVAFVGYKLDLYDSEFRLVLIAVFIIGTFVMLIGLSARSLNELDAEREKFTEQLKESETRYRGLFERARDAIYTLSPEGVITSLSPAFETITGFSRAEWMGKPFAPLIHPDDLPLAMNLFTQALRDEEQPPAELRFRMKSGAFVVGELTTTAQLEQGRVIGVMGIARDVTERKYAEQKARQNLERVQALHEIDLAVASTLKLGDVLRILLEKVDLLLPYSAATVRLKNKETGLLEPTACRNLDEKEWKAEPWKGGRGLTTFVLETKNPLIIRNAREDPRNRDPEFLHKQGLTSYLGIPLLIKNETLGVLSFYTTEEHDFSEEEIAFASALAGQAAIAIYNAQLYEGTKKQALELEKANKIKSQFLSVMSHELRTPINIITGYTDMIHDGLLGNTTPEQEKALQKVHSYSVDLLYMVNGILNATQIEAGQLKLANRAFSLKEFLTNLQSTFFPPSSEQVSLRWDYSADLPMVTADYDKIKHILQNLINNAIKFTDKGSVTVSARVVEEALGTQPTAISGRPTQNSKPTTQNSGFAPSLSSLTPRAFIEFKVADTGTGIAARNFNVIFEMFKQLDSSETRLYGGVGLGLYIVKKFTELLGGKVEVQSELGKGSTFTVTIPC